MNRTVAFLSLAGGLALLALVLAVPRNSPATPTGPSAPSSPVVAPTPPLPTPPEPVKPTADTGSLKMQGRLSHPVVGLGSNDVFMTVDLTGAEVPGSERAPVNLALVIDRSGSMAGEKLADARRAARQLVEQLRPSDRLAIVHYGSDVRALKSLEATPENKERMLRFIQHIEDDGGTNIGDGLQTGRAQLAAHLGEFKVNRMILISDGQPTEGVVDGRSLMQLSRRIHQQGVTVSSIGVGSDFNEDVMQGIAEYGAGAYGYLQDSAQLATIFQKDLQQAGTTVARNVELSFELPDGVELTEVLGYRFTRAGRTIRVPMTDFSAGQQERVVVKLRVNGATAGQSIDVAKLDLAYTDLLQDKAVSSNAQLAARVSDRREEIASRQDKDVTVVAARAEAAKKLEAAADSLAHGDRERAKELMNAGTGILEGAGEVAGPMAVAGDLDAMQQTRTQLFEAEEKGDAAPQVKAAKAKALRDFGRMGSTY